MKRDSKNETRRKQALNVVKTQAHICTGTSHIPHTFQTRGTPLTHTHTHTHPPTISEHNCLGYIFEAEKYMFSVYLKVTTFDSQLTSTPLAYFHSCMQRANPGENFM